MGSRQRAEEVSGVVVAVGSVAAAAAALLSDLERERGQREKEEEEGVQQRKEGKTRSRVCQLPSRDSRPNSHLWLHA